MVHASQDSVKNRFSLDILGLMICLHFSDEKATKKIVKRSHRIAS